MDGLNYRPKYSALQIQDELTNPLEEREIEESELTKNGTLYQPEVNVISKRKVHKKLLEGQKQGFDLHLNLAYYVIHGQKSKILESIGLAASKCGIKVSAPKYPYVFGKDPKDLAPFFLAEAVARDKDGNIAYGASAQERNDIQSFAMLTAFSECQSNAMVQLIPQHHIKYVLGASLASLKYEPPILTDHHQNCLDFKEEIDAGMTLVNDIAFWTWVTTLYTKGELKKRGLTMVNDWSILKRYPDWACKLSALLEFYLYSDVPYPFDTTIE